jgi:hypothetical protein
MVFVKKNNFGNLCFAALSFCFLQSVYSQIAESDSSACRIEVRCDIPNLNVYLDNRWIGRTPLPECPLQPGEHAIRIQNPDLLNWMSRDWESTISIHKGENRIIQVRFDRMYWIDSSPSDASIFCGDRLLGRTPASVTLPDENSRNITLELPGYQSQTIDPTVQESRMLHVTLEKIGSVETERPETKSFFGSKKFWIIGGGIVALASGIAGYYYKDQAEKAYRNYLKSGNPKKMEEYYNDSKKFDTRSGVLYGIGEVSLGITLFLSLRESSKN